MGVEHYDLQVRGVCKYKPAKWRREDQAALSHGTEGPGTKGGGRGGATMVPRQNNNRCTVGGYQETLQSWSGECHLDHVGRLGDLEMMQNYTCDDVHTHHVHLEICIAYFEKDKYLQDKLPTTNSTLSMSTIK